MATINEITVDLLNKTQYVLARIQQGDNIDRVIKINLTEDGQPYIIPSTALLSFKMLKPDGKPVFNTISKISDSTVQFPVTPQISSMTGRSPAQIQINNSVTGGEIKTLVFHMLIDKEVYSDELIVSTGEFTVLQDALLKVADASTQAEACEIATDNANLAATLANEKASLANTATQNVTNMLEDINEALINTSGVVQAEENRATAEETRELNEDTRISNEIDRQEFYTAYQVCEPYDNVKPYTVGNKVTYNGSTYQCKSDCASILPTESTNWICIAGKGLDGDGAGDMVASVYDPQGKAADIFAYVGDRTTLATSNKADLVSAINETFQSVGDISGSNVTDSEVNGNIIVDGNEVEVYTLPSDVARTSDIPDVSNKLETINIKAGSNITVSTNGNDVTINSDTTSGSTIADSEINGNVIINGAETNVYTLPPDVVVEADLLPYAKTIDIPNVSAKLETTNIKAGTNIDLSVSGNDVTINSTSSGGGAQHSKTARFVVGTSTAGWTDADCDYLCDGTEDQTEINAAITALPVTGGEIVILDGTYNITAKIDVTKDNVSIRGNGNATILRRMFDSTDYEGVITLTGRSGCKIANLQVDENKTSYALSDNSGVYLNASNNNTITGNICNDGGGDSIYLNYSNSNTITDNICNNSDNYGIYLNSSNNNIITSNICSNGGSGIGLEVSSDNNTITGNICNNNGDGVYLNSSNNNTITGNICNDDIDFGIRLDISRNNTVTGNACNNNDYGIYLDSSNNTVTSNACNNNYQGIYLETSSNNTITGNTCIRGKGLTTDYSAGQHTIKIEGEGNSYNLISNNNCMGKAVTNEGGTGNTLVNNKFDAS